MAVSADVSRSFRESLFVVEELGVVDERAPAQTMSRSPRCDQEKLFRGRPDSATLRSFVVFPQCLNDHSGHAHPRDFGDRGREAMHFRVLDPESQEFTPNPS